MEWKNQLISTCPNANNLSGISWQVLTDANLPKEAKSEFVVIATSLRIVWLRVILHIAL